LNIDNLENALVKEENTDLKILNKLRESNENEKYPNNDILNMDYKQDYLMEFYPLNQSKSFDIIKKIPSSLKSIKEEIKNLPQVI